MSRDIISDGGMDMRDTEMRIFVVGWILSSGYTALSENKVYIIRSAEVHNHPRFGSTWNYQSTEILSFDEDEHGVFANVKSGKKIYLKQHWSRYTPPKPH